MAMLFGMGHYCRLAGRVMRALSRRQTRGTLLPATRWYSTQTTGDSEYKLALRLQGPTERRALCYALVLAHSTFEVRAGEIE